MSNKKHDLHYVYPPCIEKCNMHRLATRIFKGAEKDQLGAQCQCCERRIGLSDYQGQVCCYDNSQLAYIGPGIPLLFQFIKLSIILMVALILVFSGFAIYSNITGTSCSQTGKCSDIFDILSIINKSNEAFFLSIQNYTLLGFTVLFLILMQFFRYRFRKVQDESDDMVTSPSDYALILRRLPQDTEVKDIQQMVQQRRSQLTPQQRQKTQNLKVVQIILSFCMTQYKKIRLQNKQQFIKLLSDDKHQQFKPKDLPTLNKTASIAVIIFSRQQSKKFFRYKPNVCQKLLQCLWTPCIPKSHFKVKGVNISIQRAPQPDDIVWENSKITMSGAICRKTIYSIFSILLLLVGGGIQYGLALAQNKGPQDKQTQLLMSTASSAAVSIINVIIQIFMVFTSHRERNETLTQYNTVLMVKISLFQFLNTGIFVVLANFLADPQNFSLNNGFVLQITQVMIMNAVLPNITLFILTYFQIIQKIKRCLIERGSIKYSQYDANQEYQGPIVELPYKYAYVFKTIWLTAFYAPLSPIVVPISVAGLFANYWIQKCLFNRSYSVPNMTSSMVNDSAIQLLQYFTLIFTLGQFIVYLYFWSFKPQYLPINWSIPIYVSIGISVLNLILPMDSLNKKFFKMAKDKCDFPSYEKVEEMFEVTYQMTNPAYPSNRKRKRDVFVMKNIAQLFNGPNIQMTGMNLNSNLDMNGNNSNLHENLIDQKNQGQRSTSQNPFNALFGPLKTQEQNGNLQSNQKAQSLIIQPNKQNQKLIPNQSNELKTPTKNLLNMENKNLIQVNNVNLTISTVQKKQNLTKKSKKQSIATIQNNSASQNHKTDEKPKQQKNAKDVKTTQGKPQQRALNSMHMNICDLPQQLISKGPIMLAPESQSSYSSTREMRKIFKMPEQALNYFRQF